VPPHKALVRVDGGIGQAGHAVDVAEDARNKVCGCGGEFEADNLLPLFWQRTADSEQSHVTSISQLSLIRSALDGVFPRRITIADQPSRSPGFLSWLNAGRAHQSVAACDAMVLGQKLSAAYGDPTKVSNEQLERIIASMQLFAGETVYRTPPRRAALKMILRGQENEDGGVLVEPDHLVEARGNNHLLPYSDLETACRELAREAERRRHSTSDV